MYADKARSRSSATHQTRDVLISAMRERQPDLYEHVTDVAELAAKVATELGMPAEERDKVARAAELHDIGKVAIPDALLTKPGPLNEEEWKFMRRHTLIGERILMAAPALRPVAELVRSSHERWDGGGYPDQLREEQIPLGARVVAVCDSYEAMVCRPPLSRPDVARGGARRAAPLRRQPVRPRRGGRVHRRDGGRAGPHPGLAATRPSRPGCWGMARILAALSIVGLAVAVALTVSDGGDGSARAQGGDSRPNVVMVMTDDQNIRDMQVLAARDR